MGTRETVLLFLREKVTKSAGDVAQCVPGPLRACATRRLGVSYLFVHKDINPEAPALGVWGDYATPQRLSKGAQRPPAVSAAVSSRAIYLPGRVLNFKGPPWDLSHGDSFLRLKIRRNVSRLKKVASFSLVLLGGKHIRQGKLNLRSSAQNFDFPLNGERIAFRPRA